MSQSTLCVEDYGASERRFFIPVDSLSDRFPQMILCEEDKSFAIHGYFEKRKIGLFKRNKCVVIVYTDGECLKMAMQGHVFNLSDSGIVASIHAIAPFGYRFELSKTGHCLLKFTYWFCEHDDMWPERDIFRLVLRITHNTISKERFLAIWNELAAGKPITRLELFDGLNDERGKGGQLLNCACPELEENRRGGIRCQGGGRDLATYLNRRRGRRVSMSLG